MSSVPTPLNISTSNKLLSDEDIAKSNKALLENLANASQISHQLYNLKATTNNALKKFYVPEEFGREMQEMKRSFQFLEQSVERNTITSHLPQRGPLHDAEIVAELRLNANTNMVLE